MINIHTLKPIDRDIILQSAEETGRIITIEDHNLIGGLGSAVAEIIAESGLGISYKRMGLQSFSKGYGSYTQLKEMNGIGVVNICNEVRKMMDQ